MGSTHALSSIKCEWGDIPNYHDNVSYKYLGYYVNTKLDFRYQYETMVTKMSKACKSFGNRQKQTITMHKAINYVDSDLISKLRYRIYLIIFHKHYLRRIETLLVQVVKRMAGLASSTPTDLLIDQGLYNIFTLQSDLQPMQSLCSRHFRLSTPHAESRPRLATHV
jgi:hypothetical protein